MAGAGALFFPEGDLYAPTHLSAGPWAEGVLHGGPVGALFADLLEAAGGPGFTGVRLTLDLMRPVPLRPLAFRGGVVRQGRRLQLLAGELAAGDTAVARCSLLRLAEKPLPPGVVKEAAGTGTGADADDADADGLGDGPEGWQAAGPLRPLPTPVFVGGALEMRVAGSRNFLGARLAWFRLLVAVVEGRPPTPLARAAAVGDMGNALSAWTSAWPPPVSYVTADMSLHLARPPEGEWVRSEAASAWTEAGLGLVTSRLSDRRGEFAVAHQALALDA